MGKIEYCNPPNWNPIVGCYGYGCKVRARGVCWAMGQAKRQKHRCNLCYDFIPHLHPERLDAPLKRKKSARICTCFMADILGVPRWMTLAVLDVMRRAHWHTFICLTKQAQNIPKFDWPPNVWLGVTVNTHDDVWRITKLRESNAKVKFASCEPLYEPINDITGINWLVIGAQSRPNVQPECEWVEHLIERARELDIAVFLKDNLDWNEEIKEYPLNGELGARIR